MCVHPMPNTLYSDFSTDFKCAMNSMCKHILVGQKHDKVVNIICWLKAASRAEKSTCSGAPVCCPSLAYAMPPADSVDVAAAADHSTCGGEEVKSARVQGLSCPLEVAKGMCLKSLKVNEEQCLRVEDQIQKECNYHYLFYPLKICPKRFLNFDLHIEDYYPPEEPQQDLLSGERESRLPELRDQDVPEEEDESMEEFERRQRRKRKEKEETRKRQKERRRRKEGSPGSSSPSWTASASSQPTSASVRTCKPIFMITLCMA